MHVISVGRCVLWQLLFAVTCFAQGEKGAKGPRGFAGDDGEPVRKCVFIILEHRHLLISSPL